jgi:iron complex outermembrane receptor protein
MRRVTWVGCVIAFVMIGWPLGATAEEPSAAKEGGNEAYFLEDIVVTATKTPKTQANVTQKVDVINGDEIEQMVLANGNLAETVSHLPGAYVNVLARNQPNWGSVGGLGTNYNTYMLDGLPMDSFCDPMSIDPWIVERIEVQRGPASVLYPNFLSQDFSGNQSPLAGTTNFILKERADVPGTRITSGYGSFNTFKGRIDHRNHIGNLHYYLGGTMEYSDYTNYRYKLTDAPSGVDMTEDPDYLNKSIDFRPTYFFDNSDKHKLSLYVHHLWHDADMGRPNRELDHNYFSSQAKYDTPLGDRANARVQLGYLSYDRNFGEDSYPSSLASRGVSGVDQTILPGDISIAINHHDGGLLTLGSDFQLAEYQWFNGQSSSDLINDADAQQYGVYLQEEYQKERWILRIGGRYNHTRHQYDLMGGQKPDDTEKTWDSLLWSAGLRYKATHAFSIFTNVGTSHLVPAAKFIGGTIRAADEGRAGYSGMLPNPDLDAEKGMAADVGFDLRAADTFTVGIRGFYNTIDDAVVTNTVHADVNQSQAINAGKSSSYGVEVALQHQVNPHLSWFANYTYTHSRIENDVNPDLDDVELSGYPEHMGNLGAFVRLPYEITASARLRLVGDVWNSTSKTNRTRLNGYEVLSMKIEKSLSVNEAYAIKLFLEFNNMTDNNYKTIYYYQDPGFTTFGGIQLTF